MQVSTVDTSSGELAPAPSPDELTLYFGSDRPDAPAKGNVDIWMTKRAAASDPFEPPLNVQELNTSALEWPDWLSPDNCRLYFDRDGATGRRIYVAERAP